MKVHMKLFYFKNREGSYVTDFQDCTYIFTINKNHHVGRFYTYLHGIRAKTILDNHFLSKHSLQVDPEGLQKWFRVKEHQRPQ